MNLAARPARLNQKRFAWPWVTDQIWHHFRVAKVNSIDPASRLINRYPAQAAYPAKIKKCINAQCPNSRGPANQRQAGLLAQGSGLYGLPDIAFMPAGAGKMNFSGRTFLLPFTAARPRRIFTAYPFHPSTRRTPVN